MISSMSLLWRWPPSAFWIENVFVIKWCCASPHVLAEFGSEWCVQKKTSLGAVVPSLPFMKFDSTRVPSWDVTPSLHSRGENFAGFVTEFKGKLSAFFGVREFHVFCLKQGIWMVAMLVAIAVAASTLEGWPDTVVSKTAPRCLRCWLLVFWAWSVLFVILIWGRLAYVVSLKGQQQRIRYVL